MAVINAHMGHGATANCTSRFRRALHAFYIRWDKPQQQYQKKLLAPGVQQGLSGELRKLLALDDPLNDRFCAETPGINGFMR